MAAVRRHTLDDKRVEAVEGPCHRTPDPAALGRVRVDIIEMREPGRVFEAAMHGDAVRLRSGRL